MGGVLEAQSNNSVRIRFLVTLLPGIHLRELQRLLGVSFNSTRYHVERLAKAGEILRVEERGYSRFYPVGIQEEEKTLFTLARGKTDRRILACLNAHGCLSNKTLCDLTSLAKSTISEHLDHLTRAGLVKARVGVAGTVYELDNPARVQLLIRNQNPTLLKKATDRFIDLWDF